MDFSEVEQMYLKRIFEVHSETPEAIVKTTQLAEILDVSPASVTEMIQRLSDREMVTHIPYKGCRLTPKGFQLAARIKRRECLLELLFTDIIGFQGDVSSITRKMEHAVGKELEASLDALLGFPEKTSGGTRIPSIDRSPNIVGKGTLLPLNSIPIGYSANIEAFLVSKVEEKTIEELGIRIGSTITNTNGTLFFEGNRLDLSSSFSLRILARVCNIGS